jgi:glycerol-3-phosphate O-acyltransferase
LKAPKTGLLHATMQAQRGETVIIPVAVAYDLVLEDHIIAHLFGGLHGRSRRAWRLAAHLRR